MTLPEIEAALAAGHIFARMSNGREWRVRRNGQTKIWKTRPGEFRIPVKAGLRAYGSIEHDNFESTFVVRADG
jgi:hypothetical protein